MAYLGIERTVRRLAPAAAIAAAIALAAATAVDAQAAAPAAPAAPAAAAPAAPAPAADQSQPSPWIKTCSANADNTQQVCITSQELSLTQDGSTRVSFSIQPTSTDGKKFGIGAFVPLGFVIPAGVVLTVDGDKKAVAQYLQCNPPVAQVPPGCLVQAEVSDDFMGAMRKGSELALVLTNGKNQQLPIKLTLAGFAKSYDGQGIDPVAARAQEAEQSKPLQDAARAAVQKLIDQQDLANGTTPAAPAQ